MDPINKAAQKLTRFLMSGRFQEGMEYLFDNAKELSKTDEVKRSLADIQAQSDLELADYQREEAEAYLARNK